MTDEYRAMMAGLSLRMMRDRTELAGLKWGVPPFAGVCDRFFRGGLLLLAEAHDRLLMPVMTVPPSFRHSRPPSAGLAY